MKKIEISIDSYLIINNRYYSREMYKCITSYKMVILLALLKTSVSKTTFLEMMKS